ncbi:hypothetical protein GE21DRAFT_1045673 [Neurospora crassa]|nr:hypothetical protein GE21DRAFT_1045673 [Neurospora crassa]
MLLFGEWVPQARARNPDGAYRLFKYFTHPHSLRSATAFPSSALASLARSHHRTEDRPDVQSLVVLIRRTPSFGFLTIPVPWLFLLFSSSVFRPFPPFVVAGKQTPEIGDLVAQSKPGNT